LNKFLQLNNCGNIKFQRIQRMDKGEIETFDVFITVQKNSFSELVEGGLLGGGLQKMLVKLDADSSQTIARVKELGGDYAFRKVGLDSLDCKLPLTLTNILSGAGYYQLIHNGYRP
jgi:hypothetical protein